MRYHGARQVCLEAPYPGTSWRLGLNLILSQALPAQRAASAGPPMRLPAESDPTPGLGGHPHWLSNDG
jgi:hypothetical protein